MSYLLQEIYGIENKNNQETKVKVLRRLLLPDLWVPSLLPLLLNLTVGLGGQREGASQNNCQVYVTRAGTGGAQGWQVLIVVRPKQSVELC